MWRAASGAVLAWKILLFLLVGAGLFTSYKIGEQKAEITADFELTQLQTEYVDRIKLLEANLAHINELLEACRSRLETSTKAIKQAQVETDKARREYATSTKSYSDRKRLCGDLSKLGYKCQ